MVITTYSLAQQDEQSLSSLPWEHLVLDEAQNIKNPAAKQTQAIKRLQANHRVALTGTPVENRLSELWSIMDFLNSGYLGSARSFRRDFVHPIEKFRNHERTRMLRSLIMPFVLRRLKTDQNIIRDLPLKTEMKEGYHLTAEQASLYAAVVEELLGQIEESEGIRRKGLILSALTRLKQICNHPALFLRMEAPWKAVPENSIGCKRCSSRCWPKGTKPWSSLSLLAWAPCYATTFREPGVRSALLARWHPQEGEGRHDREVPVRRGSLIHTVAESRGDRPEPDRRQSRLSLRPLVESGG